MEPKYVERLAATLRQIHSMLQPVLAESIPGAERASAGIAFGSLKRAATSIEAILLLGNKMLVAECAAVARVICEASLNAVWMLERNGADLSPDEREKNAWLLMDDAKLTAADLTRRWVARGLGPKSNIDLANQAEAEVRGRRGLPEGKEIGLPNLWRRTQAAGDRFLENYDFYFRSLCLDAHSSVNGLHRAVKGFDDHDLEMVLFMTCHSVNLLLDAAFQLMGRTDFTAFARVITEGMKLPKAA